MEYTGELVIDDGKFMAGDGWTPVTNGMISNVVEWWTLYYLRSYTEEGEYKEAHSLIVL